MEVHCGWRNLRTRLDAAEERFVLNGYFYSQIDKEFEVALGDANNDILVRTRPVAIHSPHTTEVQFIELP